MYKLKAAEWRPQNFSWQVKDRCATITLNRPERKNPLTFDSYDELRETMDVLQHVAEGDLTRDLSSSSSDELGQLGQSVNTMRTKMGAAVGHSKEIAEMLSESASQQAASLEETLRPWTNSSR